MKGQPFLKAKGKTREIVERELRSSGKKGNHKVSEIDYDTGDRGGLQAYPFKEVADRTDEHNLQRKKIKLCFSIYMRLYGI